MSKEVKQQTVYVPVDDLHKPMDLKTIFYAPKAGLLERKDNMVVISVEDFKEQIRNAISHGFIDNKEEIEQYINQIIKP